MDLLLPTEAFHAVPLGGVLWSLVELNTERLKASSYHLLDYIRTLVALPTCTS